MTSKIGTKRPLTCAVDSFFLFFFVNYLSYTRDIQLFATRIVFVICIVDVIYIKTFVLQIRSNLVRFIFC